MNYGGRHKLSHTRGHSSITMESYTSARRAKRTQIGFEAVLRLGDKFAEVYGESAISLGSGNASGTDGKPDLLLKLNPHPIAVEVKHVQGFTTSLREVKGQRRKVRYPRLGYMKLYRVAWDDMTRYAKGRRMRRMLVVEYGVRGGGQPVYMWLTGREVDEALEERLAVNPKLLTLNIGFWEMHRRGQVLRFREGELERWLNAEGAVESSQTKLQ